ncbi:AFG1/ZapE family ATPase [Shigella flexneri]
MAFATNDETRCRWINYGWRWWGETRKFTDVRNEPSAIGDNGVDNQTLAVSFTTLCVDARSQHDDIALSRLFHTVMLFDVPVMTWLMESEARRFIALVDEFTSAMSN